MANGFTAEQYLGVNFLPRELYAYGTVPSLC